MPKLSGVAPSPEAAHARVRTPVSLSPMKIFCIALCCAGLYAAVLCGMAIAQDPAATPTTTPEASQTLAEQALTPTPTASAQTPTPASSTATQPAAQTPTPTASSTPTQT